MKSSSGFSGTAKYNISNYKCIGWISQQQTELVNSQANIHTLPKLKPTEKKEWKEPSTRDMWDTIKRSNVCNWSPRREERENETEAKLEKRMIQNFVKIVKNIHVQIQDTQ